MTERPVILTGFHFTKMALAAIAERYEIAGQMEKPTPAHIPAGTAGKVQAIVSTGSVGLSAALMDALPRLSLFCCYGTGYERVDLAGARKRNIMVTHGADANAPDVAEMALGLLLASTRRIVRADKMIRRGDWTKRIPNRFGAIAGLTGGKVGILGLGAIGLEFAREYAAKSWTVIATHHRSGTPEDLAKLAASASISALFVTSMRSMRT